jgi:hypothetical protein
MQAPYSLQIKCEQLEGGNGLKATVNYNAHEKLLALIVRINNKSNKNHNQVRASVEFFEDNNRIEDIKTIIKDKRFRRLIEYYREQIIYAKSRKSLISNDTKTTHEASGNIKDGTILLAEVSKAIFSRSRSKINRTITTDFFLALKYVRQELNVYTSYKSYNQEEITIARTFIGHRSITLLDRKFGNEFFYLHLANVMLANELILKPTRDLIMEIEKGISYLRRGRALGYSFVITAVHIFTAYRIDPNNLSFLFSFSDQSPLLPVLHLIILPLIWPITAFCMRVYGSRMLSIVVRHTINRILKS